jgi:hypothetical protein
VVIIKVCIRSIESVDSTLGLGSSFIRVGLREEYNHISGYTIEAFGGTSVVTEIYPFIGIGNWFMLMTIPFCYFDVISIAKT